ncbi:MAG TPA: zf-HC2 domain-containing protein [Blastocatellia bacterium]|nr:zf-HC2 domain-containing protein [Blastocatellia bacterium]
MASRLTQKVKQEAIFWLARRLPTCKELAPWMSESLERELSLRRRIVLKLHLWICAWCERYYQQIRWLRDAARYHAGGVEEERSASQPGLSPEARERIRRALIRKDD